MRPGPTIDLPALESAKIELYRAMRSQQIGKAELARRLNWHLPQVDRVLKVRHGSQLEQLEAAFGVLGKRLTISIVDTPQRRTRPRVHAGVLAAAEPKSTPTHAPARSSRGTRRTTASKKR